MYMGVQGTPTNEVRTTNDEGRGGAIEGSNRVIEGQGNRGTQYLIDELSTMSL